jgi:hypothetical protein
MGLGSPAFAAAGAAVAALGAAAVGALAPTVVAKVFPHFVQNRAFSSSFAPHPVQKAMMESLPYQSTEQVPANATAARTK